MWDFDIELTWEVKADSAFNQNFGVWFRLNEIWMQELTPIVSFSVVLQSTSVFSSEIFDVHQNRILSDVS